MSLSKELIIRLKSSFEEAVHEKDGVEFWLAREIHAILDYTQYRNFLPVIEKARLACEKSGFEVQDHFADVRKMVQLGSGAEREIDDVMLSRYACYLVAQNGDPRKKAIAFAQSYFAVQTRKQEVLEERIKLDERLQARKKLTQAEKELSKTIFDRGVDNSGFGRIRSKGDTILFGGHNTGAMKLKLGVPQNRPLADFLPTITITAKNLAAQITDFNVKQKDLHGEEHITTEHISSNLNIRESLLKSGIRPEELPPEEDIKKLERRVKAELKKLGKQSSGKPGKKKD